MENDRTLVERNGCLFEVHIVTPLTINGQGGVEICMGLIFERICIILN